MQTLELWTDLPSRGGAPLDVGRYVREVSALQNLRSVDPSTIEQLTFTMPRSSEAADVLAEGQCARLIAADGEISEGIVQGYTITRGASGVVQVTAPYAWAMLATLGLVTDPNVTPLDGLPVYEFQVSGTPQELIEEYLTNRAVMDAIATRLAWLSSGTYDVSTIISLDVSFWSPLQFINGIVDALADAYVLAERRFTRVSTTSYAVNILAVAA